MFARSRPIRMAKSSRLSSLSSSQYAIILGLAGWHDKYIQELSVSAQADPGCTLLPILCYKTVAVPLLALVFLLVI